MPDNGPALRPRTRAQVVRTAAITGTLAIACILWIDLPVARAVKTSVTPEVYNAFYEICRLGEGTYWAIAVVALYLVPLLVPALGHGRLALPRYRFDRMALYLGAVLATGGILVNILKHSLGRTRPSKFLKTGIHEFDFFVVFKTSDAFPSGHATTIWGAMIALWFIYPPLRWLYIPIAVVVSAGRVVIGKHYVGDIVAGAGLAIILCLVFRDLIESRWGTFGYPIKRERDGRDRG